MNYFVYLITEKDKVCSFSILDYDEFIEYFGVDVIRYSTRRFSTIGKDAIGATLRDPFKSHYFKILTEDKLNQLMYYSSRVVFGLSMSEAIIRLGLEESLI